MSVAQPVIKRLDHLGLIAAFCHEVDLPGIIDRIIPKYSDHNVSHGDAVLAMILNGLGFHSRTLHMFDLLQLDWTPHSGQDYEAPCPARTCER